MRLVVVVPFLNEQVYMPTFLASVAAQRRYPDRLVLVDDGSTDESAGMAQEFPRRYPWATVLARPPRRPERDRLASAKELVAFQWALGQIDEAWDVIAKLDADLRLSPSCFERIEHEFAANPELGMAGPYLAVADGAGMLVRQRCPPHHVEGPVTFYRRACYEQIAPLPPILGWDTMDELRAQMRGWTTRSFALADGDCEHLRPMGSHDGMLRAFRRWGTCAYNYGEHPLHVVLVGTQKLRDRPYVLGGISYLLGWALTAARRGPRAEAELRAYVRRDQMRRIRARLLGPTVLGRLRRRTAR